MRNILFISLITTGLFLTSCFQDLDQDPPFNYPPQPTPPPIGADGQMFYMSFDEDLEDFQSLMEATKVGNPGTADGKKGKAYKGASNSYLTFNVASMAAPLGSEMTFGFWYNLNGTPNNAGILTISPKTDGAAADKQNNRTSGIRIFREGSVEKQRIKANVGNGTADSWLDGGDKADLIPATAGWKHIALVLSTGKARLYIGGNEVAATDLSKISWNGCDIMSIGSGAPRFTEWKHLSDNSLIDELKIFNKALSEAEIKSLSAN